MSISDTHPTTSGQVKHHARVRHTTWWAWDPRIVSTVLMALIYLGQLGLRASSPDPERGARRAGVAGVLGFAIVPVVHFSVVWWRSLHQPATLLAPDPSPPIDVFMLVALLLCTAATMTTAAWLLLRRLGTLRPPAPPAPRPAGTERRRTPAGAGR
ncbi:cytochrome c biogenesis protein CcsA [Dactylosporangium aurantiacum]|uniref:Heme exporter protein C n=1 Tax=Dactylosporangium aurantiacum TaxID=35754 RepID=A0A9Q9ITG0_9ACTN|nr:cytochrome c biogenesis protein CcsA [Dactylosporangium aurantiacum]UWZ58648.1 cytochrome c biogenesis protein CcsA [Dactylosporangium aurantiacum]